VTQATILSTAAAGSVTYAPLNVTTSLVTGSSAAVAATAMSTSIEST